MTRKIILNLAMSLDGFIADTSGNYDWIYGDGNRKVDTKSQWSYDNFLKEVDTVIMGHHCFKQNLHQTFSDKKVYVACSEQKEASKNICFIQGDICKPILEELKQEGKNIFLFGGGITIDPFIKENMIDEYIIAMVPILLGEGHPLFLTQTPRIRLFLEACYISSGITILHYKKKL
ncbi:MAG: dihydrofolate reductase family protein [Velocimicrobium sp.]